VECGLHIIIMNFAAKSDSIDAYTANNVFYVNLTLQLHARRYQIIACIINVFLFPVSDFKVLQ